MSIYPAPTNQQGSIFNPSLWVVSIVNGVTTEYLDANYLRYPVAQGNINLSGMTNIGTTALDDILDANANININGVDGVNYLQFPDGSRQYQAGGGGGGDVSTTSNNTFLSPATTQTFDTQSVVIDDSSLSFPNGGRVVMGNGTSILNFPNLLPSTSSSDSGLAIGWNQQLASNGEVDMICYGQGGQGGFAFYSMTNTTTPSLITQLYPNGISFIPDIISSNTFTNDNYFNKGYINLFNLSSVPSTLPLTYSQFLSVNNNPWFSPPNGGGVQITTSTSLTTTLTNYALLAGPTFTGNPKAPTATSGDSSTSIATTAFVATSFALKNSPALTGTPTAPTATAGNNTTQIATTAFVFNAVSGISGYAPINSPQFTGTPTSPTPTTGDNTTNIATTEFVSTAISNSSTTVTAQFNCTSVSFNSQWSGYIPLNITMNSFTFLFYTNTQSTSPTLNSGFPLTSNNTQFSGFGTATKQNYTSNGNSQYGYIFTILNYYGAPSSSPNLTMYSVTLDTPSTLGCCFVQITGLIDNNYYYNLLNNKLTLIITKWN
jgi:hypothetical protein